MPRNAARSGSHNAFMIRRMHVKIKPPVLRALTVSRKKAGSASGRGAIRAVSGARLLVEPILEDAGGGEGVHAGAFLHAGVVAREFSLGMVAGEELVDAVDGELRADGLLEFEDEAFGESALGGHGAVGIEGEADDKSVG